VEVVDDQHDRFDLLGNLGQDSVDHLFVVERSPKGHLIAVDLASDELTLPRDERVLYVVAERAERASRPPDHLWSVRNSSDKSGRIPLTCTLPEQGNPGNQ